MKKNLSLLLGLLTAILFSAAMLLYVSYPNPNVIYAAAGLTLVSTLLWAYESRSTLTAFLTRKSTYYGANMAFIVALVLGILVFVNVIAKDHHWRKDLTGAAVNSLSPQSIKILHDLKQKVKVYYFSSLAEKEAGEPVFLRYGYESKNFVYEFVDTVRRPTFVQSMGVTKNETVLLVLEGTNKKVKVEGVTEEKITNGLIQLFRTKEQSVYFTIGHGERPLEGGDALGYATVKAELEKQGYTVKELNLFSEGKIPADASVLVVAGPSRAFFPKELDLLDAWIKNSGRAIFALDLDPAENGLAKGSRQVAQILRPYGLSFDTKMLVDPTSKAANVEPQVLLGFSGSKDHPVTKDFAFSKLAANFLFPLTTHILPEPVPGFTTTALVTTSQNAWAESDWDSLKSGLVSYQANLDKKGRMTLAMGVETQKKEGANTRPIKLVAFGTSNFAADSLVDKVGNRDLFLNAVAWLSDDEQLISIRPKAGEELRSFDNSVLNLVLLVSVFLMPIAIVLVGVVIWVRRSKL